MNEQNLKNFIALVAFDQNFLQAQETIIQKQTERSSILSELELLNQKLAIVMEKKHNVIKMQHEQELKLTELHDQESHLSANAQAVSNTREYDAAVKELEAVRLLCNQQEQKMMQYSNKVATVTKEVETYEKEFQEQQKNLQEQVAAQDIAIAQAQEELQVLESQRLEKKVNIPQDWLDIYKTMQGKIKDPVVPVNQESCSACFYFMSSRDLQLLKTLGLMQCKDCYRFLYLKSE